MGDIFVGSANVFILLRRTSKINLPKNKTPKMRSVFYLFLVSLLSWFCCYLAEALRAGVREFTVDDFILIPGFPP